MMIDGWGGGGAGDRRRSVDGYVHATSCFRMLDVQGVVPGLELP